jgi:Fur family transcriptional regulator, ferric uptake regulator
MDDVNKAIYKQFKGQGYRITKARENILAILGKSSKHMSVDDIYLAIRKTGKNIGVTTIYRAVDSLARAGVLRRIALEGRTYYEMINEEISGHHHHLICRNCQRVMDYSDFINEEIALIKKLEKIVSKVHKFKVDDHQISFTGLCKLCK